MHINCKNPSKNNNNNKKLFSCLFSPATNGTTHTEGDCGVRGESKMQRKRLRRKKKKKIHFNLLYCSEKYQTLPRRMSFILKITCGRASCLKGLQLTEGSSYLRCLNYSATGDIYGAGPCIWPAIAHNQKLFVRTGGSLLCPRLQRASQLSQHNRQRWHVSLVRGIYHVGLLQSGTSLFSSPFRL